ncbi:glutamate--tRNA ligase [Hornefia butyriciproducens]|uniref:glutamate--tRNA ligase n=1 Tax=Hornefia butyriciproducens TaxID=2652293 RepID=UPI002A912B39|nr:glutamate--tRNA ligase family protein [Hornefia butyriciproducens]MDY5463520.1 glutamate--tRNA ligase family protein [Hornefia butyriciproducens]
MDYNRLAELLFPQIQKTPQEYEEMYPPRTLPEGAKVTRLGPSPTGFIHLGNLYGAFADERLAHQSGGVFYLRIEDTDDKRYVDGAVETIIDSLRFFGIQFDEGATRSGDVGDYGDYTQSHRGPIYQCFAKKLVSEGKAYPCFLTEQEIGEIRAQQEEEKVTPGIYGRYARCRDWSFEQVQEALQAGRSYVIRLKSDGREAVPEKSGEDATVRRVEVVDAIRGRLTMPENFMDTVILKATGIPTYHFAHVVDDHLMRTTHVVRGAEWLSSLPVHVELFEKLGWEMPVYCHTAQLMKLDEQGNRRKLSKREDPELSLDYYRRQGYHPEAVREYLLTILNSDFEEWRIANPNAPVDEFRFTTEKMSSSGALFDLNKLNDISKDVLLKIPADRIYEFLSDWSREFAPEYSNMFEDREYMLKILDLGRGDKKPRKDLIYARQIVEFISYFFDKQFRREDPIPAEVPQEDVNTILSSYLSTYDHSDDQSRWFDKIREIATELGYAAKPKDFKKHPEEYKGHVGHVSTVIRIALMGRAQSPDVWTIQQIMGEEKVRARISDYME